MRFRAYSTKLIVALVCVLSITTHSVRAQSADSTATEVSIGLDAAVGLAVIENADGGEDRYFSSALMPTFQRGSWQLGLLVKLRLNQGGFREEDYDEARDYLSIIRFLQYQEKGARGPYLRAGDLEEARIGYGQVVQDYANTVSLDRPRLGFAFDIDEGEVLFESFVSDLSGIGVYGVRGAWRPMLDQMDSRWRRIALGVSVSGDLSRESRLINPVAPGVAYIVQQDVPEVDSLGIVRADVSTRPLFVSADLGVPIASRHANYLLGYVAATNMVNHGWGFNVGTEARRELEDGRIELFLEQRFSFGEYFPAYFNALYEVSRIQDFGVSLEDGEDFVASNGKRNLLEARDGVEYGSYVALAYRYKDLIRLKSSYEHAWNRSNSGWFRADVRFQHPDLLYAGRFSYDVINVGSIEDITAGPTENSLFRVAFAYRFWTHLLLGGAMRQSFEPRELNGRIVGQAKRTRFEPYIVLRI